MSELALANEVTLESVTSKASELLAECLEVSVSTIETNKKLTSYGLDSINAVTMVGDLEDWFDLELPSTLLWDQDTISNIAHYIVENLEDLLD